MLSEAADRMRALDTDMLPVVENRRIVGIIAAGDVAPGALPGDMDPRTTPVRRVMTPGAVCCSQEDDVEKAIRIMETRNAHRLIVLDSQGQAVGVLSAERLASQAGEHLTTSSLREGENHESPRY
jgi:CBS domain-containing protein